MGVCGWKQDFLGLLQHTVLLAVLLCIGGGVFHGLEDAESVDEHRALRAAYERFASNLTEEQWAYLTADEHPLCSIPEKETPTTWSFGSSMFFALTIVTTIGYGNQAPSTVGGRVFTMIYGLVGIAITAHTLESIAAAVHSLLVRCVCAGDGEEVYNDTPCERCERLFERTDKDGDGVLSASEMGQLLEELTEKHIDPLELGYIMYEADKTEEGTLTKSEMIDAMAICYKMQAQLPEVPNVNQIRVLALGCFVWCIVAGAIMARVEEWLWFEGFYFSVITFTTIGLGDYVPDTNAGQGLTFAFLIPGLGMIAKLLGDAFAWVRHWRFWALQRAFAAGTVSRELLLVEGYLPLYRKQRTVRRIRRSCPDPPTRLKSDTSQPDTQLPGTADV